MHSSATWSQGDKGPVPAALRARVLGMWLFLASLVMLFGAGMVAYLIVRLTGSHAPPPGAMRMPLTLWLSTPLLLLSSVTLEMAIAAVARERQAGLRKWLAATWGVTAVFVALQAVGLRQLLEAHFIALEQENMPLLGLAFCLVLVHGLHVVGGLVPMAVVTHAAGRGRYDHEYHQPLRLTAMYWHFLAAVWLAMFSTILIVA